MGRFEWVNQEKEGDEKFPGLESLYDNELLNMSIKRIHNVFSTLRIAYLSGRTVSRSGNSL